MLLNGSTIQGAWEEHTSQNGFTFRLSWWNGSIRLLCRIKWNGTHGNEPLSGRGHKVFANTKEVYINLRLCLASCFFSNRSSAITVTNCQTSHVPLSIWILESFTPFRIGMPAQKGLNNELHSPASNQRRRVILKITTGAHTVAW